MATMTEQAEDIRKKLKTHEKARGSLLEAIAAYEYACGIPLGSIRVLRRNGKVVDFTAQPR